MRAICEGPACGRGAVAEGLCASHYRQKRRGRTLTPIRVRGNPLLHVTIHVPDDVLSALGAQPSVKAREVLIAWAAESAPARARAREERRRLGLE